MSATGRKLTLASARCRPVQQLHLDTLYTAFGALQPWLQLAQRELPDLSGEFVASHCEGVAANLASDADAELETDQIKGSPDVLG